MTCVGAVQTPLFLIDGGARSNSCRILAELIHSDIPVHVLQGLSQDEPPLQTIEGIAARTLHRIRRLQPFGPYHLAGWSAGGAIAYEIAAQLLGQEQLVAFLGLIDAPGSALTHTVMQQHADGIQHSADTIMRALNDYLWHPLPIQVHSFAANEPLSALGRALSRAIEGANLRLPSSGETPCYQPRVTIQMGQRQRTPLFCVPGAGDSVVAFSELANALGPAWPVQGLQARGLDGVLVPHSSVEAAASTCLNAILEFQPAGAVHLLGHSFGGWVALEIAHQLRAARRVVASLTMVDTDPPDCEDNVPTHEYGARQALLELIEMLELAAGKSLGIDPACCGSLNVSGQCQLLHAGCVRVGLMPRNSQAETLRGVLRTFGAALRTGYVPRRTYPERARLVLVSDPRVDDETNRRRHGVAFASWRRWAPNLISYRPLGNHITVLKPPCVQAVADWLCSGLASEAQLGKEALAPMQMKRA